ncbi:MAG TPA: carboxypeptidase-like regulatory domain-containing protein, partial [Candidatus Bathyarchaeia archaeon]
DPDQSSFKISGYILDANGHGIGGANVIFNVPSTVPSVYSDFSGYYGISAPAGTYHINVWPPFDSNYVYYDEQMFGVGSDKSKNITLNSGYKISGYISDSSGTPVKNAIVSLNNYLSGWFSKDNGYYFVTAPAGAYKLSVTPRFGYNHFQSYYEHDFVINNNLAKNITVGGSSAKPSLSPTSSPSPTPSATPAPTQITISTDTSVPVVGSVVGVNGRLSYVNGTALQDKLVAIFYAVAGNSTLVPIGSAITNENGKYNILWVNGATGTLTLKAVWIENASYPETSNTTTLSFLPYNDQTVFFVESNSTVRTLAFFSTSSELSFAVSGPENTTGYVKATIAKSLISDAAETKVYVDGNLLGYILTET